MSLIRRVAQAMERIAPLCLANRSWDNVGILIEHPTPSGTGIVMLTIDLTPEVLEECVKEKVEVIVAYHPRFFSPTKSLTLARHSIELNAIAAGMSLFSPHTSLDAVEGGINDWLASLLCKGGPTSSMMEKAQIIPIEKVSVSEEERSQKPQITEGCGVGRIVTLPHPILFHVIANRIKKGLHLDHLRVAIGRREKVLAQDSREVDAASHSNHHLSVGEGNFLVQTIAVCAGSGGSVFKSISSPVDVLWTGEMSHHEVLEATAAGRSVILCEHSNTERGYLAEVLHEKLQKELGVEGKVLVSKRDVDPLCIW